MADHLDPILPPAMAAHAEDVGVKKATSSAFDLFVLAVLAGAFIAIGAAFATTVATSPGLPYGVLRLLVGLAVWLTFSARTTADKVMAVIFPISAFVAIGFEHCVANMYFIPAGILAAQDPAIAPAAAGSSLGWSAFLISNLLPVTLGNIIGGTGLVAVVYWSVYLRPRGPREE